MAKKKALVVAINDYGGPPNDLPSCLEDARQFSGLLARYGFDEIKTLLDGQATVAKVEEGLTWLFSAVAESDRIVFYYSGHGFTRLVDGVMEEMLVLTGPDPFFLDNKLVSLAKNLPPAMFTAILDSCFSGGMRKMVFDPTSRTVEIVQTKLWDPPPEQAVKALSLDKNARQVVKYKRFAAAPVTSPDTIAKVFNPEPAIRPLGMKSWSMKSALDPTEATQPELRGLLISACKEDETAAASTARTDGMSAFTHSLLKSVNRLGLSSSASAIFESTSNSLEELGFRQTPLVLEPQNPGNLQQRSFLTLEALSGELVSEPLGAVDADLLAAVLSALLPAIVDTHKQFQARTATASPVEKWLEILVPAVFEMMARVKTYSR